MSIRSFVKRLIPYAVLLILGILIGAQLLGAAAASPPADEGVSLQRSEQQVGSEHPDTVKWYNCTPANVATYTSRVHVKCDVPDGAIWYFAWPSSDSKGAARTLSLLLTAQATGSSVTVLYDTEDTSGTAYGCAEADCRAMMAVAAP